MAANAANKTMNMVNNALGGGATQSITDRLQAAKYSLAGQGLAKTVAKATTEELIGPKRKHLDYLTSCTHEPNISIPQMADLLLERTKHTNWIVVFKSLTTIHNLMNYGSERFSQYVASNSYNFNLSSFTDKQSVQGYDMSTFIRRYSKYITAKATSYRLMAFDFCKVKRGKDEGILRQMPTDKLLKTLPVLQDQVDALLEFDAQPNELCNPVVSAAFMLLFKDLIRMFACYNDGVINLLEKFFDMGKKQAREALDIYKKFLVRMDQVQDFFKTAERIGVDKGEIPDLTKAPASLLEALESHVNELEGKKGKTPGTSTRNEVLDAAFAASEDDERQRALEEERRQLDAYKANAAPPPRPSGPPATTPQAAPVPDFFSLNEITTPSTAEQAASLNLFDAPAYPAPTATNPFAMPSSTASSNPWDAPAVSSQGANFMPNFDSAFSAPAPTAGAGLQAPANPFLSSSMENVSGVGVFGEVLTPSGGAVQQSSNQQSAALTGSTLDNALSSLVDNLSMSNQPQSGGLQWTTQKPVATASGSNGFDAFM